MSDAVERVAQALSPHFGWGLRAKDGLPVQKHSRSRVEAAARSAIAALDGAEKAEKAAFNLGAEKMRDAIKRILSETAENPELDRDMAVIFHSLAIAFSVIDIDDLGSEP